MRVPKRKSEEFRKYDKAASGPLYITNEGLNKLTGQLARAETELPDLIKEVEHTKSYGDFSENAEYQDAKARLRRTHSRIAGLKDKIKRAAIIQTGLGSSGVVKLGSTVAVATGGQQKIFVILGSQEADPSNGRISNESPLGQILLGKPVGSVVRLKTKRGETEYKIVNIK